MLFTYWTHPEEKTPPSWDEWKDAYPYYKIFGDDEVLEIMNDEELKFYYTKITLPAAKSDIARLVLLREFGGLYMDAHTCPARMVDLVHTLDYSNSYEMTLFGKKWEFKYPNDFNLMNTVILCRKNSNLLDLLLGLIRENLKKQYEKEKAAGGYADYDIHFVTGTYCFVSIFFDESPYPPKLKEKFIGRVNVDMLERADSAGFHIYKNYTYRKEKSHWSERQKVEPLFRDCLKSSA
ncbi:glycosyltransferase [Novacetimonas pomaceti]|uniref:Uncharacterized protein n=1 Tax=Novacetimonas pomaceti TaxID=2021998 RepID=A0A318QCV2_9PROT|nr:glycosyltransferase [Novacetimonas pomaceti]PYD75391.1 hypothetical protein CFR71_09930 [Novacetimonas pomaceti]